MSKVKNVETKHFIAEMPDGEGEGEVTYLPLARGILDVGSENDETTEEFAYYSGDGTPETDVISIKKNHPFEGHFYSDEPSHELISDKEFSTGSERNIMYKQERSDGKTYEAPATLLDVNVTGGPAEEYRPISGTISWNRKPTETETDTGG